MTRGLVAILSKLHIYRPDPGWDADGTWRRHRTTNGETRFMIYAVLAVKFGEIMLIAMAFLWPR